MRCCRWLLLSMTVCALAACNRTAVLEGVVQDFQGQALPGVSVTVRGQGVQALSNARGEYRLRAMPGWLELDLAKTGYTPGRVGTEEVKHGWNRVDTATLWPLPMERGAFILENYRFLPLDRGEPKSFATRELGKVHATTAEVERAIADPAPRILCHRMPPYDLRMHEVIRVLGADPAMEPPDYTRPIWAPSRPVPIIVSPIDELEKLLIYVQPTAPLTPGVYAVHWGAFDGYTGTDSRVFLFRVENPDEAGGEEEEEEDAGNAGST